MSYSNASLSLAQAKLIGKAQTSALRERTPEVTLKLKSAGAEFYNGIDLLKGSETQPTALYVKNRNVRPLGTAYSHNHTGLSGTASIITPTWSTAEDKFSVALKQANGNVFQLQEMLNYEYENSLKNLTRGIDDNAVAYLQANRDTTNATSVGETVINVTTDVHEVSLLNESRAVQISGLVMDIMAFNTGTLTYYCNSIAYGKFQAQAMRFGASNSSNESFQFEGKTFIHCPKLVAPVSYTQGYWLVAQDGLVAMQEWVPIQNRNAIEVAGVCKYSATISTFDTLMYGIHEYAVRADGTSVGGGLQDVIFEYEIFTDVTMDIVPLANYLNGAAGATPIQAFGIV